MATVWQKAYSKRNFRNRPDTSTPLGESNLTPIDNGIDTIDDRVVTLQQTKAEQSDFLTAFKSVSFNSATGVFTFTKFNDTTVTVDTDIEKIAINFDYDDDPTSAHYQQLIITLEDGTVKYVDLSAVLTVYEFTDTTTIHFSVSSSGVVSANVINGSITSDHLAPSVMADINAAVSAAEGHATDSEAWAVGTKDGTAVPSTADQYQNNSKYYAEQADDFSEDSEAYAIGKRDGVDVTSGDPAYHNNSKYWSEQSQALGEAQAEEAEAWAKGTKNGTDVPSTAPQYHDNAKYWADQAEAAVSNTVRSFNGRTGAVTPSAGDYDLDDMGDVNLTSPTDGQGLRYDSQSGKWVNGDAASAVSNLTDVDLTNLANGEILKYNSTSQKWENKEDSAGHTIQNESGTALTQRSNMQFKGNLKASDDSTNQRTVVDTKQSFAYGSVGSQSSGVYIATASGYELGEGVLELNFGIAVQATVANGIHINVNNQGAKVFRPLKQLSVGEVAFNVGDFATFIYNRTDDYFTQVKTGHTLINQGGTALANRDKMQFPDAHLEDDSANTRTKVEIIKSATEAQWESATEDGLYDVDIESVEIGSASDEYVSVTASGDTYGSLFDKLADEIDFSKLTPASYIIFDDDIYRIVGYRPSISNYYFTKGLGYSTSDTSSIIFTTSGNYYYACSIGTNTTSNTNKTGSSIYDGTKATLYYGNKSAVIDLQTTANRCLMSSGESVESLFTEKVGGAEHIVGRLDGRNVYQRRINVSLTAGTRATFDFPSGYSRYWVSNEDSLIAASTYGSLPINFSTSSHYILAYMENNQLRIESDQWSGECWVNVRYIKS